MTQSESQELRHPRSAFGLVLFLLFLTFLDNTIVSVTLADIQRTLHSGIVQLQWVVNGYMLTFAAFMLTGGTLGDLFGRKKIMLWGVAIFSIGALICLVAQGNTMLIAGRVVMGAGAAASEPGTLSMIRHIYPDREQRARAIGVWAAICSIALALGPILGGLIIGFWSWRGVFALSLALGAFGFVAGWRLLPENSDPEGRHLDVPGLTLGSLFLVALSVAVIQGESSGYDAWWIIALFAVALVSLIGFIRVERRSRDPVLKLEYFRTATFSAANIVAFAANFGIFTIFFFTPLYLQILGGFTGVDIALAFLSMAGAMILGSIWSGRWVARHGPRLPSVLGCFIACAGLLVVRAVLGSGTSILSLAWPVGIVGLGLGMTIVATNSASLSIVEPERSGMASSTVNTAREIGGVLGVSILGAVLNSQLTSTLRTQLSAAGVPGDFISLIITAVTHGGGRVGPGGKTNAPPGFEGLVKAAIHAAEVAFGQGLRIAFLISAAVLFVGGLVAWRYMRRVKAQAEHGQPAQAA